MNGQELNVNLIKKLTSKLECLQTKGDFSEFMSLLIADLRTNRQDWENRDLESYLNAIMNWTEDMDGYYQNNNNLPTPSQCRLAYVNVPETKSLEFEKFLSSFKVVN